VFQCCFSSEVTLIPALEMRDKMIFQLVFLDHHSDPRDFLHLFYETPL